MIVWDSKQIVERPAFDAEWKSAQQCEIAFRRPDVVTGIRLVHQAWNDPLFRTLLHLFTILLSVPTIAQARLVDIGIHRPLSMVSKCS